MASYSKSWLTPKNILLYLVVGGLIYAAYYYLVLGNKSSSLYTTPPASTEEQMMDGSGIAVVLTAQNNSGQSGIATLQESNGQTTVTIQLDNVGTGVPQPAHIHTGACPVPGAVTYPLSNVVDGASQTVLDVDLTTLQSELPLAVNVHKSAAEAQVYVSCGDLY